MKETGWNKSAANGLAVAELVDAADGLGEDWLPGRSHLTGETGMVGPGEGGQEWKGGGHGRGTKKSVL